MTNVRHMDFPLFNHLLSLKRSHLVTVGSFSKDLSFAFIREISGYAVARGHAAIPVVSYWQSQPELIDKIRSIKEKSGSHIVLIDNLSLLIDPQEDNWQGLIECVESLDKLSRELQSVIVGLLNADDVLIRMEGEIEMYSDVLMFLEFGDKQLPENATKPYKVRVEVAKNRMGPAGISQFVYFPCPESQQ